MPRTQTLPLFDVAEQFTRNIEISRRAQSEPAHRFVQVVRSHHRYRFLLIGFIGTAGIILTQKALEKILKKKPLPVKAA